MNIILLIIAAPLLLFLGAWLLGATVTLCASLFEIALGAFGIAVFLGLCYCLPIIPFYIFGGMAIGYAIELYKKYKGKNNGACKIK